MNPVNPSFPQPPPQLGEAHPSGGTCFRWDPSSASFATASLGSEVCIPNPNPKPNPHPDIDPDSNPNPNPNPDPNPNSNPNPNPCGLYTCTP